MEENSWSKFFQHTRNLGSVMMKWWNSSEHAYKEKGGKRWVNFISV